MLSFHFISFHPLWVRERVGKEGGRYHSFIHTYIHVFIHPLHPPPPPPAAKVWWWWYLFVWSALFFPSWLCSAPAHAFLPVRQSRTLTTHQILSQSTELDLHLPPALLSFSFLPSSPPPPFLFFPSFVTTKGGRGSGVLYLSLFHLPLSLCSLVSVVIYGLLTLCPWKGGGNGSRGWKKRKEKEAKEVSGDGLITGLWAELLLPPPTDLSWLPPPKEALWASGRHMGGMHALLGHLPPISAALPLLSPAQVAEEWMKERIHPWVGGWVAGGVHSSRSSFLLPPALLNIFGRRVIIMCTPQSPPPLLPSFPLPSLPLPSLLLLPLFQSSFHPDLSLSDWVSAGTSPTLKHPWMLACLLACMSVITSTSLMDASMWDLIPCLQILGYSTQPSSCKLNFK